MNQTTIACSPFGRTTADLEKFIDHALQNTAQPPFLKPRFLSRVPRAQQRTEILPVVMSLPDLKASSSNQ